MEKKETLLLIGPAKARRTLLSALQKEFSVVEAPSAKKALGTIAKECSGERAFSAAFFEIIGDAKAAAKELKALHEADLDCRWIVRGAGENEVRTVLPASFGELQDRWDCLSSGATAAETVQKFRQMVAARRRERDLALSQEQRARSARLTAIAQMARGIGHALGNILLKANGRAELAYLDTSSEKAREHLTALLASLDRAGLMVRNLQTFSRTGLEPAEIDPAALVEDVLVQTSHELERLKIKVVKAYGSLSRLRGDPRSLSQALLNVIENAIQALSGPGRLRIEIDAATLKGHAAVAIRVSDTGPGIPAEHLPRLFDFAFTTKGDKGSGLGLPIAREVVEGHGGEIQVASRVGRGTSVTITLPTALNALAPTPTLRH